MHLAHAEWAAMTIPWRLSILTRRLLVWKAYGLLMHRRLLYCRLATHKALSVSRLPGFLHVSRKERLTIFHQDALAEKIAADILAGL